METINMQQEDLAELKSLLGFDRLDKNIYPELLLGSDLIESTWNLISKIRISSLNILENLKSKDNLIEAKSTDNVRKDSRTEKLFDNFSEFLNEEACKDLEFTISEKSPSTLLNTIYPIPDSDPKTNSNIAIDFSGIYFAQLKNFTFTGKDVHQEKNGVEVKEKEKDLKKDEKVDTEKNSTQYINRNADKKKNNQTYNNDYERKNQNNGRNAYTKNQNRKNSDFNSKNDKEKKINRNKENLINIDQIFNDKSKEPKIIQKSVDELFSQAIHHDTAQIEVIRVQREENIYNSSWRKTDNQNYNNDSRGDNYQGDNYGDYQEYSNGNCYNPNKRNNANSYNGNNGKNIKYAKKKY